MQSSEEPVYKSYGEFCSSQDFALLFQEQFEQKQREAAEKIVSRVLRHCDGKGEFPLVRRIVDLGCGDGSLLLAVRNCLESAPRAEKLSYVGVDACADMIKIAETARARIGSADDVRFVTADLPAGLSDVKELQDLHWAETAVLCLGHTWFHFLEQEALLSQIKKLRPCLLLVDVFKSWDEKVAELEGKLSELSPEPSAHSLRVGAQDLKLLSVAVQEEARVLRSPEGLTRISYLRTQLLETPPGKPSQVVRGRYEEDCDGSNGRWIIATQQVLKSSVVLRPGSHNAVGFPSGSVETLLRAARADGEITGDCGYLVLREFDHVSGWGGMHCIAFAELSVDAVQFNQAYFEAVSNLVSEVFVDDVAHTSDGKPLAETSDERFSAVRGLRQIVQIFGRGEVAVIMPFDRLRVFARMVPLKRDQVGNQHCKALAEIDLILEHPNRWQQRFPTAYSLFHAMLDRVSSPIGFTLGKVPGYDRAVADRAFEVIEGDFLGDKAGESYYFIVPFYFGSLPLFALILEEPTTLPSTATNAQVYSAFCQNMVRQLQIVVSEQVVQSRVVVPFLLALADAKQRGAFENVASEFDAVMHARPWKSWATALPSHPLLSLDGTSFLNRQLLAGIRRECRRVAADAEQQIAIWFGDFFDVSPDHPGLGHDEFVKCVHVPRLKRLRGDCALQVGQKFSSCDYFKHLTKPWREFIDALFAMIESKNEQDVSAGFKLAKRLFCRCESNQADRFRFSFSRLYALAMAGSEIPLSTWLPIFQGLLAKDECWFDQPRGNNGQTKEPVTSDLREKLDAFSSCLRYLVNPDLPAQAGGVGALSWLECEGDVVGGFSIRIERAILNEGATFKAFEDALGKLSECSTVSAKTTWLLRAELRTGGAIEVMVK